MPHIKSSFSIKDLENLSGIKAHTIRIWEKRYGLLQPERTDTNIRFYSLTSLRKLLNVSLLNSEGIKISKIAKLDYLNFDKELQQAISNKVNKNQFINQLKVAMLNYDAFLFEEAYSQIEKSLSFSDIFKNYFVPFLNEIGLLWQSGSINPTHEHFISNIIKQKILVETYKVQLNEVTKHDKLFVLFLPDLEIHDLGLTYLQYEVIRAGYKSVLLGSSVPIELLKPFISQEQETIFVSYFTVQPSIDKIPKYFTEFSSLLLQNQNSSLYVLGKQITNFDQEKSVPKNIRFFHSLDELINQIS